MFKSRVKPIWVVFAGVVVLAYSMGVRQTISLMLPQIAQGLDAAMGQLSFGFAVQNLLWGLVAPIAGMLAERFGTVRVLLVGALLYGAGLLVAGLLGSALWFFVGNALLVGVGVGATTFPIVLAAVGKRFPVHQRSLALGIASAGGSLGQFLFALLIGKLEPLLGWSATFVVIASTFLLVLLVTPLFREEKPVKKDQPSEPLFNIGAIREAFKIREYQLLNIGFFVCGFHVAFISVHMAGFVAACGLPTSLAADSMALIGLVNIVGSIFAGWAGGRWHKPWLLVIVYWLRACLIMLLFVLPVTETLLYIFSVVMGMLWLSTVPLTSGCVAQVCGTRNLATLFGVVMLSHQVGAFFGSWSAGVSFDLYGSYDIALLLSAALGLLAAAVHLPMTPQKMARFQLA